MIPFYTLPFALSALVVVELAGAVDPVHVSLQRRSSGPHTPEYYNSAAANLRAKYGYGSVTPGIPGRRRATVDGIPVINAVRLGLACQNSPR